MGQALMSPRERGNGPWKRPAVKPMTVDRMLDWVVVSQGPRTDILTTASSTQAPLKTFRFPEQT